jgi:hypothetical protein
VAQRTLARATLAPVTGSAGIREFLATVRRRLLLRAGLQAAGYGAAGLLVVVTLLGLVAASIGPAGFWPVVTSVVLSVSALVALGYGLLRPARALRDDLTAARRTGLLIPDLASDLLSAVELDDLTRTTPDGAGAAASPAPALGGAPASPQLIEAFQEDVAKALVPLSPRQLVPLQPAAGAMVAAFVAACGLLAAAHWSPLLANGLRTLVRRPSLFEGAAVSTTPLVGDVRLTYSYPEYTGLPARTVEGSTGDIAAVKGTRVRVETHPLRKARRALMLLGETGDKGEIAAAVNDGALVAELTVSEDVAYRFWLEPPFGRSVREERSHHITAEADGPPRVEIMGPADRLELATPRPIEIGYTASDDYGLGAIELVYRVGDRPEQRVSLRDGGGARGAQGRTLWDPAPAVTGGATRIAYRVEARDRDAVSGPKVGTSRTLYVIIQNAHETLEDRLERQRELLEKLLTDLGDRLEHDGSAIGGPAPTAEERLSGAVLVHDAEEAHLTLLGQLIDEDRRSGTMGKALRNALAGIADRLEKLLREERQALAAVKAKPAAGVLARLDALAGRHVAELENDVLILDDLIGRQRLEDLASLGKELTDAHQRLQDLLARYQRTKDEGLRRQLEREVRELRARIADLAAKIAAVKTRNDVDEEWRNLPDLKSLANDAKKLDDLLEKRNDADLAKALAQLGDDLRAMRQQLDQNLEGFGAERFPQENRVVAELMKKIGDIEGDERSLHKETQAIADKQEAEAERRLKGQLDEFLKKEGEKVERLKQRLSAVPTGDRETALAEEVNRARDSAKQLRRLLSERDLAEAKGEADRAGSSLDRALDHVDELSGARRGHRPGGDADRDRMGDALGEARALAQEIADDIAKVTPRPSETMTPQEREAARGQADKQGAISKRTEEVADEAARRLGKLPGMEKAEGELKGAAARMRQATEALKRDEPKGAATAERDAADRLAKLRDSMQERSMGSGRQSRDPVRIPGADESTAPRAWRQELLDAMKEKAPERFRDDVRRYYEELVR